MLALRIWLAGHFVTYYMVRGHFVTYYMVRGHFVTRYMVRGTLRDSLYGSGDTS